jgi:hypothetical protein
MLSTLALAYTITILFLTFAFLYTWFKQRRQVRPYRKYGLAAGGLLILFEVLLILTLPGVLNLMPFTTLVLVDGWAFLRIAAFTIAGIYFSMQIGHFGFPVLMRRFGLALPPPTAEPAITEAHTVQPAGSVPVSVGEPVMAAEVVAETTQQPASATIQPVIEPKAFWLATSGVVVGALLFTALLFKLTSPQLSSAVRALTDAELAPYGISSAITLPVLLIVMQFAFAEEIIFRLGFQNFLAKVFNWRAGKYWIAIGVAAAV